MVSRSNVNRGSLTPTGQPAKARLEQAIVTLERLVAGRGRRRGRPPAWMSAIKRRGRPPGTKNKRRTRECAGARACGAKMRWQANYFATACLLASVFEAGCTNIKISILMTMSASVPTSTTAALRTSSVLASAIMCCLARMPLPVARLVRLEVIERTISAIWGRSGVSVVRVVAIVNMTVKAATAVKPWSSSDEKAAIEPVGPIVPIRGAVVRSVVIVPIRASGRCADTNHNLSP